MTKEQRAEYRQTLAELEHIKELYANALKAAENVVTERRQKAQNTDNQNLESKASEDYTNNVNYALEDNTRRRSKRSGYSEYNTIGMQWAYNASTKIGDKKVLFKQSTGKYVLVEATKEDVGFIELNSGSFEQMTEERNFYEETKRENERLDRNEETVDKVLRDFGTGRNNDIRNNVNVRDRGKGIQNAEVSEGKPKSNGTADTKTSDGDLNKTNFSLKGTDTNQKAVKNSSEEKITLNMHDDARVEVLNKKSVNVVSFDAKKTKTLENVDIETLQNSYAGHAGPIIKQLVRDFGILNMPFYNADIELEFNYSGDSVRESINKQHSQYGDFVKMLSVFPDVLRNAVGVETHKDKYIGTTREDTNLNQMYVLASAFSDEKGIYPVKLEVKEFKKSTNKLYLSVVLTKKGSRHLGGNLGQNQLNTTPPTSNISIADLVSLVNPSEGDFLKYFPDSMLDSEQIEGKNIALAKDAKKIEELSRNNSLKGGVSATELFDTVDDARKGKKKAVNKLAEYVESGAMSTELYDALIGEYGAIPTGEKAHRDIQVPRKISKDKKVSQTVRTILEAKATPDEAVPTIEKLVEDGTFSYDVYTDKQAMTDAGVTNVYLNFGRYYAETLTVSVNNDIVKKSVAAARSRFAPSRHSLQ